MVNSPGEGFKAELLLSGPGLLKREGEKPSLEGKAWLEAERLPWMALSPMHLAATGMQVS